MAALYYRARHAYTGTRDGRVLGPWEAGDLVCPHPGDLAFLTVDSPGLLDLAAPLTQEQARELIQVRQQGRDAAAELAERREAAVREHTRRFHGRWCGGRPGVDPHELFGDLVAVQAGDGWLIGCGSCVRWQQQRAHVNARPPRAEQPPSDGDPPVSEGGGKQ